MSVLRYEYPSDNRKCPKNAMFCFFWALQWRNCIIFDILWTAGHINWLTPQSDHKDRFTMGAVRYVYVSEKRKCIFCFYLALYDISKVSILRQLFIIIYQFIIIHMQIGKNQRKISFHIGGTNFCNNLHLAISLCIIQF